jgi:type II secretion system protein G
MSQWRRDSALIIFLSLACSVIVGAEKKPAAPATRPSTAPSTRPARPDPRVEFARNNLASFDVALDAFEIDNARYPTTAEGLLALVQKPAGLASWHGPYVRKLVNDPWDHPYVYKSPGVHNPTGFDLSSNGPDGRESADDINNWTR